MTLDMFPLSEIPYEAYARLLDTHRSYLKPFIPNTLVSDLKLGKANRLIYWYPRYILDLYDLANKGLDYLAYLDSFHETNSWYFKDVFRETCEKLDKIKDKKLNENILGEIRIKNGSIK
jgi:hypothetical protein